MISPWRLLHGSILARRILHCSFFQGKLLQGRSIRGGSIHEMSFHGQMLHRITDNITISLFWQIYIACYLLSAAKLHSECAICISYERYSDVVSSSARCHDLIRVILPQLHCLASIQDKFYCFLNLHSISVFITK